MKVSGYKLREALKQHELRRDAAAQAFTGSLKRFRDETKPGPEEVVQMFLNAEEAIAKLQTAQARYNLAVLVHSNGTMTLSEVIKSIGGLGRAEKMWRSAAAPKQDRYTLSNDDERDPNRERAVATLSQGDALKLASAMAKRAGSLRAAIATANAQEVEVEGLEASLFE